MPGEQLSGFKRFLLWEYPRGGWQYDVIVALILAFIFLTPRSVFRDQPRASNVVRLPASRGANVFWVEPQMLDGLSDSERMERAKSVLRSRFGRDEALDRIEPMLDNEHEVTGYLVYTRPR